MRWRSLLAAVVLCLFMSTGRVAETATLFSEATLRMRGFGLITTRDLQVAEPITRAELARLVAGAAGKGPVEPQPAVALPFRDIAGHPDAGYIVAAHEAGLVAGFPDGTFDPGGLLTYGQVVTVLARLIGLEPVSGQPWPANFIRAAETAGMVPAGLPVLEQANMLAVRGAVFILLDRALYQVQDTEGRNLYQRVFDPLPPRVVISPGLFPKGGTVHIIGKATDASWLSVNGQPVALDSDGAFVSVVPLGPGPNRIVVEAWDLAGNHATAEVTVEGQGNGSL